MPWWRRLRYQSRHPCHPERFLRRRQRVGAGLSAADEAYGRDTSGHIIAIYTAPEGKTVDDADFKQKILDNLAQVEKDNPDQVLRSIGYFKSPEMLKNMADADKQHAFMSIQLKGNDDDAILNNYNKKVSRTHCQGALPSTASTSSSPACSRWPAS